MPDKIDRRRFMGLLAGGVPLLAAPRPGFAALPVGAVLALRGASTLDRDGTSAAAMVGTDLLIGDLLRTGDPARLDLRLGRTGRLRLGSSTTLRIDTFVAGASAAVGLDQGAVFVDHDSAEQKDFSIRSQYGLLAARGTSFFAGPSQGRFGIFVRRGRVDVSTAAGKVTLSPGYGTDIAAAGATPSPPKKWARARIEAALASVL